MASSDYKTKVMVAFGTRPEAIKLAPIIHELRDRSDSFELKICFSGQHKELIEPILRLYDLEPDFDLGVMKSGQSLSSLTSSIISKSAPVFSENRPDICVVHGDTTTTFGVALAAFYENVAVAHVEAGLRSGNLLHPWPEELNRKMVAGIADIHFAPTNIARSNLLSEGVSEKQIFVTGNTVVDSLLYVSSLIENDEVFVDNVKKKLPDLVDEEKMILVTCHRRENYGEGVSNICSALIRLASELPHVRIILPVHRNPNISNVIHKMLDRVSNIYLIEPQGYAEFIYLMKRASLIITDSGGVQEEAPSLNTPVLVTRNNTERNEAIDAGFATLVGTDPELIFNEASKLLGSQRPFQGSNPFGDGSAAKRIVSLLN